MLNKLNEILRNRAFIKRAFSVIPAVLLIAGFSVYIGKHPEKALYKGLICCALYVVILAAFELVWVLAERKSPVWMHA